MSIPIAHRRYSGRYVRDIIIRWACEVTVILYSFNAEIFWAQASKLTVSLDRATPAVFQCGGQGTLLLWYINDDLVVSSKKPIYQDRGFTFAHEVHDNGTIVNTLTIPATMENNNTQLRCHATGNPGPATSETLTLTVTGIYSQSVLVL